jgi:hypothetical protein
MCVVRAISLKYPSYVHRYDDKATPVNMEFQNHCLPILQEVGSISRVADELLRYSELGSHAQTYKDDIPAFWCSRPDTLTPLQPECIGRNQIARHKRSLIRSEQCRWCLICNISDVYTSIDIMMDETLKSLTQHEYLLVFFP